MEEVSELQQLKKLYNHDFLCRREQRWELHSIEVKDNILRQLKRAIRDFGDVLNVLKLYPENLFLAGGSMVDYYKKKDLLDNMELDINDFDFFVVASNEEEASKIIKDCVEHIKKVVDENDGKLLGIRSNNCLTLAINPNPDEEMPDVYEYHKYFNRNIPQIQFINRVYSDRSQIIGMFDIFPSQIMYSYKFGLEATRIGLYCLQKNVQFVDPTRKSPTFFSRLRKYMHKEFAIHLPNTIKELARRGTEVSIYNLGQYTTLEQEIEESYHDYRKEDKKHWSKKNYYENSDYMETIYGAAILKVLYFTCPLNKQSPVFVDLDKEGYPVDLHGMLNFQRSTGQMLYPITLDQITLATLKEFFPDKSELAEFVLNCMDDGNEFPSWAKSQTDKRLEELKTSFLPPYGSPGTFLIANPGQQGAGSFQPTTMKGSEFWNLDMCSFVQVGLSHEIYWLLKQIWREKTKGYPAPKEIFGMICKAVILTMC